VRRLAPPPVAAGRVPPELAVEGGRVPLQDHLHRLLALGAVVGSVDAVVAFAKKRVTHNLASKALAITTNTSKVG
jgi:hypothetical protein